MTNFKRVLNYFTANKHCHDSSSYEKLFDSAKISNSEKYVTSKVEKVIISQWETCFGIDLTPPSVVGAENVVFVVLLICMNVVFCW